MTTAKRKVTECVTRMERADKQIDTLVTKLDRRTKLFDDERKAWYKEFLTLKELIRRAAFADDALLKALEGVYSMRDCVLCTRTLCWCMQVRRAVWLRE
jgi:hypothetical protein